MTPVADITTLPPEGPEPASTAAVAPATTSGPHSGPTRSEAQPEHDGRRTRGLDRLITFADAVVAIAVTLLVLPLVTTASDLGAGSVARLLSADGPKLYAFGLSFAVICRFWIAHHAMYTSVIDYTRPLIWWTCVFLFSIVFLPFPTEVIGAASSHNTVAVGLYIGTLLLATTAELGQQWIIARTPALQAPDTRGTVSVGRAVWVTAAMSVAFVLGVAVPRIGIWSLLLIIGPGLATRWTHRKRPAAGSR